jgi:protein HIRA/HIR1
MRISKPTWVSHDGLAIFSVHLHPDETRFATAGQDGRVKIWSLAPVIGVSVTVPSSASPPTGKSGKTTAKLASASSPPKLLITLHTHQAPVNVVRFSPDGRSLASGGDDKTAIVYRLRGPAYGDANGATSSGGMRVGNLVGGGGANAVVYENWAHSAMLRSHNAGVCVCVCVCVFVLLLPSLLVGGCVVLTKIMEKRMQAMVNREDVHTEERSENREQGEENNGVG